MNYKKYQNSRDTAWEILIREHITELPVSMTALCRSMGIEIRLYTPKDDNAGQTIMLPDGPRIYVNKADIPQRQRFTAAHELGHILAGDVGKYHLVNREPSSHDNPVEQAANVFASRLLAPACVLWGCGVQSPEEIAELCNISQQAARYRWERMQILYERNKFLTSPLERKVFRQFRKYIKAHKLH